MTICDELRTVRQDAHLTQQEMAKAVGVSRRTISYWESGQCYPRAGARRRLLRVLVVLARAKEVAG